MDYIHQIIAQFHNLLGWELIAVLFSIAYLVLALKQNIWCWPCALISTAIFTLLFWDVSLKMESALNAYYLVMAVYGWNQWRKSDKSAENTDTAIVTLHYWSRLQHGLAIILILAATGISGYILHYNTDAAWPYVDSFTTWGAIVATYMVTKKVIENWIYWLVIDTISVFLYLDRGLYLTALLMITYLVIAWFGLIAWRRQYLQQTQRSRDGHDIPVGA